MPYLGSTIQYTIRRKEFKIWEAVLGYSKAETKSMNNIEKKVFTFEHFKEQNKYTKLVVKAALDLGELRSSCSNSRWRQEQAWTDRKAGCCSVMMLQNALCLCKGIYNPVIHTAKLILSSLQCVPTPGDFPFANSDVKRKGEKKVQYKELEDKPLYLDRDITLCLWT